ncbi:hypothetical protein FA13DRAFT_1712906 [Coprinellus micaceus]|uniref:F-box domain-containing protein n=1 Tax=Coprinellus micaceus TaxID=71717 RepID=A0A4Y7SZ53_COPMI|nr:hypothetical protein FA13DRAFT_1712906 [Coprinellus micaceus]
MIRSLKDNEDNEPLHVAWASMGLQHGETSLPLRPSRLDRRKRIHGQLANLGIPSGSGRSLQLGPGFHVPQRQIFAWQVISFSTSSGSCSTTWFGLPRPEGSFERPSLTLRQAAVVQAGTLPQSEALFLKFRTTIAMLFGVLAMQDAPIHKGFSLLDVNAAIRPSTSVIEAKEPRRSLGQMASPFDRVPLEILSEIFSSCIDGNCPPEGRQETNANARVARALSQVTSLWRALVLAKPSFWTTIELDTIRPEWLLELQARSKERPVSLFSRSPVRGVDSAAVHVWSIVHANFDQCGRLHVQVTIDPLDARGMGILLSQRAPRLLKCTIQYKPHDDLDLVDEVGWNAAFSSSPQPTLFNNDAPLLQSLDLIDCHFPYAQNIFPSLQHFSTSISPENEQTGESQRKRLSDFLIAFRTLSNIKTLTLTNAIHDICLTHGSHLRSADGSLLPSLEVLRFAGPATVASILLRKLRPSKSCSFHLSLNSSEMEDQSPTQLASVMEVLLCPIAMASEPYFWRVGQQDCVLFLRVEGIGGFYYDLSFDTLRFGRRLSSLSLEALWDLHLRRGFRFKVPSDCGTEVAYSCMLRILSTRHLSALRSANTLELFIPKSSFSLSQTTYILERMPQVAQLAILSCRTLTMCALLDDFIPTPGSQILLPRLRRIFLPPAARGQEDTLRTILLYQKFKAVHTWKADQAVMVTPVELSFDEFEGVPKRVMHTIPFVLTK